MRTKKVMDIATQHHLYTDYEYENKMGPNGKFVRTQHKTWAFTETQLVAFAKSIEKEVLSKYEIIE
jgi:hypothetical protein